MANERGEVWVVDDDRSVRFVLATALRDAGFAVTAFDGAAGVDAAIATGAVPDLLFTDVRMPGDDGLVLLERLKASHPQLPVVVMSAHTDIASTAGAFRGGAQEFLSKPFDLDDAVALAMRVPGRRADTAAAPAAMPPAVDDGHALVGESPAMQALFRAIGRLAQAPLSVLVTGETGTGKELVARALHRESPRAAAPFVALNTAAIPADLLESELFGHEAGAFTGASRRHVGRFEQADGGTLFLDEIGDMPASLQTRLLRVLAEGEFFRVGGRALIRVDVRVVAATHQDLEALVADGRFRADLLHRLDVVRLRLPPLRERRGDVALLATRFLHAAAARFDAPPKAFSAGALARLAAHDWPGNVRELENLCWRVAALAPDEVVAADDLGRLGGAASAGSSPGDGRGPAEAPPRSRHVTDAPLVTGTVGSGIDVASTGGEATAGAASTGGEATPDAWAQALQAWARTQLAAGVDGLHARALAKVDEVLLTAALEHTGGRRSEAAARLGLGRNTVTRKLRR